MTKPKTKITSDIRRQRSGMTLIELLVAISILVIIAAILVPQLRFASADRNIREASRVVASMFAQASQRAINDGVAGVLIERNPNITDANGAYAATSMFLMRRIPRYIGENVGDMATIVSPTQVTIRAPIEQGTSGTIRIGDQISFGNQSQLRFPIIDLNVNGADLELILAPSPFGTPPSNPSEFIIFRQPRRLASSRIDLPTGYLIDLRLSGELDGANTSFFALDRRTAGVAEASEIPNTVTYLFNGRGSIDRFFYTVADDIVPPTTEVRTSGFPTQPAYLMVREYNPDEDGETIQSVLNSDLSMWVTVDPTTGAANVIPGVAVDSTNITPAALSNARVIGTTGQAAQ